MQPIVVTGVGAVTPLGVGARTLHERWSAGVCGIADGEGACLDFDPTDFLSAKEARRADRFTQLALAACAEALADAGWEGGGEGRAEATGRAGIHTRPSASAACSAPASAASPRSPAARTRCANAAASTSRRWPCR